MVAKRAAEPRTASRGRHVQSREPLKIQSPEAEQMVPEPRNENREEISAKKQQPGLGLGPESGSPGITRKRQHRRAAVTSYGRAGDRELRPLLHLSCPPRQTLPSNTASFFSTLTFDDENLSSPPPLVHPLLSPLRLLFLPPPPPSSFLFCLSEPFSLSAASYLTLSRHCARPPPLPSTNLPNRPTTSPP